MVWKIPNLFISRDELDTEYMQCVDEGKDLSSVEEEFARLRGLAFDTPEVQRAARALLDVTIGLPQRADYLYREPSDLEEIRSERPAAPALRSAGGLCGAALFDKIHGAWLGRCAGCLLGKPVEGWTRSRARGLYKDTGNWPLSRYVAYGMPEDVRARHDVQPNRAFIDEVDCAPEDDDTNYTVIGLEVMKRRGADFTAEDVATVWFNTLPLGHAWTAERVALRNLAMMIGPPESAAWRNPFREWIGAQIRGDFFGYAAPGDPERAAEFAFRDACISHTKNGIYGEMWVAAMLAAAAVSADARVVLEAGLAQIPSDCRLAEAIRRVMAWHADRVEYDEAVERLHAQWTETRGHHLIHVISNAMIVATGLLWGGLDFERSICRAVQAGFDTDCNGATVGSIVGLMLGADRLPGKWIDPLRDELLTCVAGRHRVRISALARETVEVIEGIRG